MKDQVYNTTSAKLTFKENGVLIYHPKKDFKVEAEHRKENINIIKKVLNGSKCSLLIDISENTKSTQGSMHLSGEVDLAELYVAGAMLVGTGLSKLVSNFIMNLNEFPFPVKIFTNQQEAETWLLQFV